MVVVNIGLESKLGRRKIYIAQRSFTTSSMYHLERLQAVRLSEPESLFRLPVIVILYSPHDIVHEASTLLDSITFDSWGDKTSCFGHGLSTYPYPGLSASGGPCRCSRIQHRRLSTERQRLWMLRCRQWPFRRMATPSQGRRRLWDRKTQVAKHR